MVIYKNILKVIIGLLAITSHANAGFITGVVTGYGGFSVGGVIGTKTHEGFSKPGMVIRNRKQPDYFEGWKVVKGHGFRIYADGAEEYISEGGAQVEIPDGVDISVDAGCIVYWDVSRVSGALTFVKNGVLYIRAIKRNLSVELLLLHEKDDEAFKRVIVLDNNFTK